MGACAQFAVFTYAEMRRTPRYEIRLAAFFADNLMNSVVHCGWQFQIHERPQQTEHPSAVGIAGVYYSLRYEMPCNLRFFSAEPRKFPTSGA